MKSWLYGMMAGGCFAQLVAAGIVWWKAVILGGCWPIMVTRVLVDAALKVGS